MNDSNFLGLKYDFLIFVIIPLFVITSLKLMILGLY